MVTKERLHRLIDTLPESKWDTAEQVLERLHGQVDTLAEKLRNAPLDDEVLSEEEWALVQEARDDVAAGRLLSHDEVRRRHQL